MSPVLKGDEYLTERENALKVFRHEIPDWLPCYTKCTHYMMTAYTDIEKPQMFEGYDWFGCHWLPVEATANLTHPDIFQKPILEDISEWEEQVKFPDIETAVDWELVGRQMNEQCDQFAEDRLMVVMLEHGCFERLTLLMGFENALCAPYDDPEALQGYCNALVDFKIRLMDKMLEVCPRIDAFDWHDDLGSQNSTLMGLDTWKENFYPATRRAADYVHSRGKLFIYHSCGKVDQLFSGIVELEPDGVNVIQATNDQPYIKKNFGHKTALICGLDNQNYVDVPHVDEQALRGEVDRTIDIFAPGGGFFAGMYLAGNFCGDTIDPNDIIEDEVTRVGAHYYDDPAHRVFQNR